MRLIDADKLYNWVRTECNPYGKPTIDFESGNRMLDMIKRSSTAFDKEKVIAKIDNASMSRCRYGFINFDLSPRRCIDCQNDFIRAVYEIVEKGGIE